MASSLPVFRSVITAETVVVPISIASPHIGWGSLAFRTSMAWNTPSFSVPATATWKPLWRSTRASLCTVG